MDRLLQLSEVAELLNTSLSQVYALVRRKELRSVKIGGRGQYRVAPADLEAYIAHCFAETDRFLDAHPFTDDEAAAGLDVEA